MKAFGGIMRVVGVLIPAINAYAILGTPKWASWVAYGDIVLVAVPVIASVMLSAYHQAD
jgi:hypothetical protein